jgi:hypothetical protein
LETTKIRSVLTVHFEYSNGFGRLPPPSKKFWKNGGYTHKVYAYSPCPTRPPIQVFSPPTSTVDLGSFDKVFAFGDSTMDQLVRQRPNKKGKYYFQPKLRVGEKVLAALDHQTIDTILQLLHDEFGEELLQAGVDEDNSIALIVGSCLWDILDAQDTLQGRDYKDHIDSCRRYILSIRQRYPKVTVVWKSPMAVHIHVVDLERLVEHDRATSNLFGIDRLRHMSASRSKYLYDCQTALMTELHVPFLDLFEASYLSSDQLYPSDGRHYRPDLNRLMLSWFYPSIKGGKPSLYYTNTE